MTPENEAVTMAVLRAEEKLREAIKAFDHLRACEKACADAAGASDIEIVLAQRGEATAEVVLDVLRALKDSPDESAPRRFRADEPCLFGTPCSDPHCEEKVGISRDVNGRPWCDFHHDPSLRTTASRRKFDPPAPPATTPGDVPLEIWLVAHAEKSMFVYSSESEAKSQQDRLEASTGSRGVLAGPFRRDA